MDWAKEAATWPLAAHSRFVRSRPHHWHLQDLGEGPVAVLLHGAGGATQSFRTLAPVLATRFRVVMMDLPGQGFTRLGTRQRSGLAQTSEDIARLLRAEGIRPDLYVAHSAGAAVAFSMLEAGDQTPVVAVNPALGPFEGTAGWLFPMLAKLLSLNPFVPGLFARVSRNPSRIEGLLASTGSRLDPAGTALYQRLITDRDHVDGTLLMMAQWSVDGLLQRLETLHGPCLFLLGRQDGAVPNRVAQAASETMQNARVRVFENEGHLLHETAPDDVAKEIIAFAEAQNVL